MRSRCLPCAGKEVMGDRGFLEFFENSQGLQLCSYYWPAQKPKGVVVLAHGHGSYIQVDWLKHRSGALGSLYSMYLSLRRSSGWIDGAPARGPRLPKVDLRACRALGEPHIYAGSWVERLNKAGYSCVGLDAQRWGKAAPQAALKLLPAALHRRQF